LPKLAQSGIVLRIADFAPEEILEDMGIDDPFELTGLYDGIPMTEKVGHGHDGSSRHDLAFQAPDP
jgi:predicted Zn-dependent protease with MMP-like domain